MFPKEVNWFVKKIVFFYSYIYIYNFNIILCFYFERIFLKRIVFLAVYWSDLTVPRVAVARFFFYSHLFFFVSIFLSFFYSPFFSFCFFASFFYYNFCWLLYDISEMHWQQNVKLQVWHYFVNYVCIYD